MKTFFLDWELWQKLTFVLACCIVIVFAIGLVKLSRTNRLMRKLHELDEEKRSRASEMRHCGITTWGPDEIPFGVRAIQRGVQVKGIWIATSDSPDTSKVASSTTLVVDHSDLGKIDSRRVHSRSIDRRRLRSTSGSSAIDQTMVPDVLHEATQTTLVASTNENLSFQKDYKTGKPTMNPSPSLISDSNIQTYMPTGLPPHEFAALDGTHDLRRSAPRPGTRISRPTGSNLSGEAASRIPAPQRQQGPMLYNRQGRRAYRCTMEANRNFVVVPSIRTNGSRRNGHRDREDMRRSQSGDGNPEGERSRRIRSPSRLRKMPRLTFRKGQM